MRCEEAHDQARRSPECSKDLASTCAFSPTGRMKHCSPSSPRNATSSEESGRNVLVNCRRREGTPATIVHNPQLPRSSDDTDPDTVGDRPELGRAR